MKNFLRIKIISRGGIQIAPPFTVATPRVPSISEFIRIGDGEYRVLHFGNPECETLAYGGGGGFEACETRDTFVTPKPADFKPDEQLVFQFPG